MFELKMFWTVSLIFVFLLKLRNCPGNLTNELTCYDLSCFLKVSMGPI